VQGGWLVRYQSHSGGVSMVTVPDPEHHWEVEISQQMLDMCRERLEKLERKIKDPYQEANIRGEMEEEIQTLRKLIEQNF